MNLQETIALLLQFKKTHSKANKAEIEREFLSRCKPRIEGAVFVGEGFVLRFCEANKPSFSNVVLSLSALQKYDSLPTVICIVRGPLRLPTRQCNILKAYQP
jgi:hypothetical protein